MNQVFATELQLSLGARSLKAAPSKGAFAMGLLQKSMDIGSGVAPLSASQVPVPEVMGGGFCQRFPF